VNTSVGNKDILKLNALLGRYPSEAKHT